MSAVNPYKSEAESVPYTEEAVMEEERDASHTRINPSSPGRNIHRSPAPRTRSLSDGSNTPFKLSPSPHIFEASRRTSKDDWNIRELSGSSPATPSRSDFPRRVPALNVPSREHPSPSLPSNIPAKGTPPLSPKLEHPPQIYSSPTNILPRRSRGLDFSRAATSLHHSTLAEPSPDSSPTIGGRGVNIPTRRSGPYGSIEQSSTSLWSMMGNQERMHLSSSLGSTHCAPSDSSTTSDDDLMDEDADDTYVTTPQAGKMMAPSAGPTWPVPNSPATGLMSFQQRQKSKKKLKRRFRGPAGPFGSALATAISRSPPNGFARDSVTNAHARRESISWQANQLHISGSEGEDMARAAGEAQDAFATTPVRDGQRSVIRRVAARRANLFPKTKGFARIRAALAEESAPIESELCREAEVVRQVRESDMDLEHRVSQAFPVSATTTTQSSPNFMSQDENLDDVPADDDVLAESALGITTSSKYRMMRNSKTKPFWDTISESSSIGGSRTTPPPATFRQRGSSSAFSEDVFMGSPILTATPAGFIVPSSTALNALPAGPGTGMGPGTGTGTSGSDSQRSGTPYSGLTGPQPPSAAEITRRINNKRRRDDDFDPISFKRRAVSPGMSVHNSPILQSPMQRDAAPWGSRPGSNSGSGNGNGNGTAIGGSGSAAPSESGSVSGGNGGPRPIAGKVRVGMQGMVDTSDGLMRMSIE